MQRHDFDAIAFTFGVVFTGLGVLFMVGRLDVLSHARWLWPGLLVLLGLAVLVGARGRGGGARATRPAFEPRPRIDQALEDDLLHSPIRTIDGESVDTSSLFTVDHRTPAPQAAGAGQPQEPAHTAAQPERPEAAERPEGTVEAAGQPDGTAVLPAVDQEADTRPLPQSRPKDEETDPRGE